MTPFVVGIVVGALLAWAVIELLTGDVADQIDPWGEALRAHRIPVTVTVPAEDCIPLDEAWAAGWSTCDVFEYLDWIDAL